MQERVTLTSSQQRIFFVDQNSGAKPIFNIVIPLKLTGQLDINNLKKAFFDVLNRHQILRMKCCQQHESLYGIITNNDFFKLNIVNFKNTQKSDKKALDFLSKKASKKFDLLKENLFKAYIINLADEEYILAIILHHIITDEWSNNVLVKDLFEFYNSYLENRIPELPKNFLEYSDYANEEQKLLSKGNFEESLRYWLENLKTAPEVSTLPTDKPRPDFLKHSGKSYSAILPESQLKGIKAFCSHQRLSLFTFLITIFKILLYRFSGQEDIVIGYPSANRLKEGTENIVGLFVNIIPLRSQFAQDISFIDFLEQTRTNLLEGYENQDFPFYQLISKIDQSRSLNHHPIFQILFTLNSETSSEISINGLQNESIPIESNFAKFDLSLFCKEEKGKLILNFNYSSELFNDSTIEKLFQLFSNILCLVMKNSEVKISEIPFLSPSEEEKLLKELSKKTNLYQYQNLTLHSMFVKVANSSPTNIAIITDESEYSYREIEDASNQFANYLLDSGIISNNKIAVSLEPSFELVVCLLGILKVGAIYVLCKIYN